MPISVPFFAINLVRVLFSSLKWSLQDFEIVTWLCSPRCNVSTVKYTPNRRNSMQHHSSLMNRRLVAVMASCECGHIVRIIRSNFWQFIVFTPMPQHHDSSEKKCPFLSRNHCCDWCLVYSLQLCVIYLHAPGHIWGANNMMQKHSHVAILKFRWALFCAKKIKTPNLHWRKLNWSRHFSTCCTPFNRKFCAEVNN